MLTPGQNPFSPTVSDSPAGNVDTGRCCPHWELRGMVCPNTAVWVGPIREDIFCWWYSTCKHLKCEVADCITSEGPTVASAGFVCEKWNLVQVFKMTPVRPVPCFFALQIRPSL